jgi:hypothetical protein
MSSLKTRLQIMDAQKNESGRATKRTVFTSEVIMKEGPPASLISRFKKDPPRLLLVDARYLDPCAFCFSVESDMGTLLSILAASPSSMMVVLTPKARLNDVLQAAAAGNGKFGFFTLTLLDRCEVIQWIIDQSYYSGSCAKRPRTRVGKTPVNKTDLATGVTGGAIPFCTSHVIWKNENRRRNCGWLWHGGCAGGPNRTA